MKLNKFHRKDTIMEILYVTFRVEVGTEEYSWKGGSRGEAEVKIQVPRSVLDNIDPGNLFIGALQTALAALDSFEEELEEE